MVFARDKIEDLRVEQLKLGERFRKLSDVYSAMRSDLPPRPYRWKERPELHFAVLTGMGILVG